MCSIGQPSVLMIKEAQKDMGKAYMLWSKYVEKHAGIKILKYRVFPDSRIPDILCEMRDRFVSELPSLKYPHKFAAWRDALIRNFCNNSYWAMIKEYNRTVPLSGEYCEPLSDSDPEECVMDREETDIREKIYNMVLEKLEKISDKKRKAIVEVILLGRSYDEVAMEEGVTPNTVRYRVEDGIRELNREFKRLANMNPTLDAEIEAVFGPWK